MTLLKKFDVVILGGGAAGLMCAATAGLRGRRVLVLERANKIGKKILMSGGGRCNFTNLNTTADNFISHNPHFCKSALKQYTQWDFIELVKRYQIAYHEKTLGQLFCDHSSKDILNLLMAECERTGVEIQTECETHSLQFNSVYSIETSLGNFEAESLVVATGGLSIPKMGASGFGYTIAQQFGLRVWPRTAGLVPYIFTDYFKELSDRLSGVAVNAQVKTKRKSFKEAILFTHRGLSGPAVLQSTNYWQEGEVIELDLLPDTDIQNELINAKQTKSKILLRNLLAEYLPRKLVLELEELWWREIAEKPLAEIRDHSLSEIAQQIKNWRLKPAGTEGYRTAEVTLGGVDTRDVSSKTMESLQQAKLFFIGEVLDVTGHLGGFNFQWAWSSGFVAGQNA